jgi:hypothetical protein
LDFNYRIEAAPKGAVFFMLNLGVGRFAWCFPRLSTFDFRLYNVVASLGDFQNFCLFCASLGIYHKCANFYFLCCWGFLYFTFSLDEPFVFSTALRAGEAQGDGNKKSQPAQPTLEN